MSSIPKLPFELAIIPIEEEQIIGEREIARRYSAQLEKDLVFTINNNLEFGPTQHKGEHHKDQKHHKHHDHPKHHDHHKNHEHHKHPNRNEGENEKRIIMDQHHNEKNQILDWDKRGHEKKHEKKFSKFKGRPKHEEIDPNGPKDRFYIVAIMFFVLGLIHILPFTFFTTANEYWMYKFRNTSIINSTDANDRTFLQTNFHSLSHMITVGPSTACQFLLTFFGHKIRANTRIFFTLCLHSLVFVIQTSFVKVDTDNWQIGFFCITVAAMTLISCSMSLGSTGNMVTITQFPDQYLKMYMIGEGVASLLTAILRLVSIVSSPTTIESAFIYFITGCVIMIIPTALFYFCTRLEFFRYYTKDIRKSTRKRIPRLKEFKEIISYTWPLLLLHIISVLIPHASVGSLVVSEYYGTDSVWGNKYFVTCCTYLLPAICGILGRSLFYKFEYNPSIKTLYFISFTLQAVYTPMNLFVNAKPRKHLPIIFPHDWQYALIVGSHALISGYTSNMGQMKSLRIIPKEKLELSILVNLFIFKILSVATSPMSMIIVNLI